MKLSTGASIALLGAASAAPNGHIKKSGTPSCRFALDYTQKEVLSNTDDFISDMLYWESGFHRNDLSYNEKNGITYDGSEIDYVTGEQTDKHTFSAASKEALQIMLYARALEGNKDAARFLSPNSPEKAPKIVFNLMEKKLKTYQKFNEDYPGFGGQLPWIAAEGQAIAPQDDWNDRVPALDNGELWWAVYAWIEALEKSGKAYAKQAKRWQAWLDDIIIPNMLKVFYRGEGQVCAVTAIGDMTLPVDHPDQTYKCENENRIDDPYEGELVSYFFHLFGDLSEKEKKAIWEYKRPMLVRNEYEMGGVGPITVERGFWFSSHEPWKVLELPYYDVDIIRRVYHNHERVRTCNSVMNEIPGLFASVNNITNPETGEIQPYISPAGIPSIAKMTEQYHEVITPYASWPVIMFDKAVGLAWWHNMVSGKKMQNPYGSTESTKVDGKGISALLTWDSKVLTVVSILGGVTDLVRDKMQADGIYDEFVEIAEREYELVFGGEELKGEDVELCLPNTKVPDAGLEDFTSCQ